MRRVRVAALCALALGVAAAGAVEAAELQKTRLRQTNKSTLQGVVVTQTAERAGDVAVLCEFIGPGDARAVARATVAALEPGQSDVAELRAEGAFSETICAALDAAALAEAERAAVDAAVARLIREANGD